MNPIRLIIEKLSPLPFSHAQRRVSPVGKCASYCSVIITVDESGTMKPHEKQVEAALGECLTTLKVDDVVSRKLRLCYVPIRDSEERYVGFRSIHEFKYNSREFGGKSPYGKKLQLGLDALDAHEDLLAKQGIPNEQTVIILLGDGKHTDSVDEQVRRIHKYQHERATAFTVIPFAFGRNPNWTFLKSLRMDGQVFAVQDFDFGSVFQHVSKLLCRMSRRLLRPDDRLMELRIFDPNGEGRR